MPLPRVNLARNTMKHPPEEGGSCLRRPSRALTGNGTVLQAKHEREPFTRQRFKDGFKKPCSGTQTGRIRFS